MKKTLYMETTQIDAGRTAAEVTSLLVRVGAASVSMDYDEDRNISGLKFMLKVEGKMWCVSLPARVDPIFKILNGRRKSSWDRTNKAAEDKAQARRVAWRQLYRWTEAQLAMVDAGMVQAGEVFLGYAEVEPGVTFFERVISDPSKLITAKSESVEVIEAEFAQ